MEREQIPTQKQFASTALQVFKPIFEKYGFKKYRKRVKSNFSFIIFKKDTQYINIHASTYPRDYPFYYEIYLGDGECYEYESSEPHTYFEALYNSINLMILKAQSENIANVYSYKYPFLEQVTISLENAKKDLIKYAANFLKGDLHEFLKQRKELNKHKRPLTHYKYDDDYLNELTQKSFEAWKKFS